MKNVLKPSAQSFLIPLGLIAGASAADAIIHKEIFGLGMNTLIISNKEIDDIMKMAKPLEDSDLLIKGVCKIIKNEAYEQKGRFLSMLLVD